MASDQLKLIDASGALVRLLMIALTLLALFGSWRAARWYMGSELALAAPQLNEKAIDTAETATRLAPDDPLSHRNLATLEQKNLSPEALKASIIEFKRAVSLSPLDFRLWVDLGRALEQAGDFTGGEKALRRAAELAPFYSWPRWHLGNFLLRRGRYDEAFAELRRVAEGDAYKRSAVFDLAWTVYGGDVQAVKSQLGDSPAVQAEFVSYLLSRGRLDEALQLWQGLTGEEKKQSASTAKTLIENFIAAKRFRTALNLSRDMAEGKGAPEVGKISNGSFENPVAQSGDTLFDWHVPNTAQAFAALDATEPRDGNLSLRINFNASQALDFNITQMVAVEPATSYRLQFYVRGNYLKSATLPVVQILSADGKVLAESPQVTPGKSDWQQVAVDFKSPPDMDGITVRITRQACPAEDAICPIFGTVWYDDFNLQLVGRAAGASAINRSK